MTASVTLPNQSVVELPSKYLKYSSFCFFCITSENQIINVDMSELNLSVSIKVHTDIYLELLQDSKPITGAEFEYALDYVLREMNKKMYGFKL